jgi:hypothetical protein
MTTKRQRRPKTENPDATHVLNVTLELVGAPNYDAVVDALKNLETAVGGEATKAELVCLPLRVKQSVTEITV